MWWTTSKFAPSWAYSFLIVLKQCAHVTTTLVTPNSPIVSMFCAARVWKSTSFPARRAESPVHVSPLPRTAKDTPAVSSSSATARVVFFARSS